MAKSYGSYGSSSATLNSYESRLLINEETGKQGLPGRVLHWPP
jgi:hypothetical protein